VRDKDWEIESLKRELSSRENTIEKIRSEKVALELELNTLRDEMSMQIMQAPVVESAVDETEFYMLRDQVTQWESDYHLIVDERDNLLNDLSVLQAKVSGLESDVDKYKREAKLSGKNETQIVSKYEVQVRANENAYF
jgi:chromosome segregation ATPase